jgi:hypothetical protein
MIGRERRRRRGGKEAAMEGVEREGRIPKNRGFMKVWGYFVGKNSILVFK